MDLLEVGHLVYAGATLAIPYVYYGYGVCREIGRCEEIGGAGCAAGKQIRCIESGKADACKYCGFVEMCGFLAKSDSPDEISAPDENKILSKMAKMETGLD